MADFYTYRNEVAGRRRKRRLFLILIVVLVLLCIGVGYFWFTRQSAPAQTSPAESATPEQAASAAVPTEAPSAAPADIAEPQRILPGVDTAVWDKSEAVAATIDTEYRNTDHRMVAVPMLGTVTNDYFNTVTFAGDSPQRIIRNVCTYERGLLFGYTDKRFDEHGWIRGMLPIVERIELGMLNTIFIGQAVNGMYAIAINWCTGHAGGGRHPSVWDEPIAVYKDAIKKGITELEKKYAYAWEHTSDSSNYNKQKICHLRDKLKEIRLQYLEPKQLSLFDVTLF